VRASTLMRMPTAAMRIQPFIPDEHRNHGSGWRLFQMDEIMHMQQRSKTAGRCCLHALMISSSPKVGWITTAVVAPVQNRTRVNGPERNLCWWLVKAALAKKWVPVAHWFGPNRSTVSFKIADIWILMERRAMDAGRRNTWLK
jgi:hypothetical protein